METRSASAFSNARDSSALLTASCKLSRHCARHGVDTVNTRNNNKAKLPNPYPKTLTDDFTDLLSLWCTNHRTRLSASTYKFSSTLVHLGFRCLGHANGYAANKHRFQSCEHANDFSAAEQCGLSALSLRERRD